MRLRRASYRLTTESKKKGIIHVTARLDRTANRGLSPASRWPRLLAAVLALAVAAIHVKDQGGLTQLRDPAYVGYGYWALEVAGVACAVLLLSRRQRAGWLLAVAVAVGPLVGFILSRSVGLPGYTDDVGNWTEPIAVAALLVEALLLVLALWVGRAATWITRPAATRTTAGRQFAGR